MKVTKIHIVLVVLALSIVFPLHTLAEETKVIQADGTAIFTDYITPAEAKVIALNNARRIAIEKAVGASSGADTMLYNSAAIDGLIQKANRAVIREEKILESRWNPLGDNKMAWHTRIQAEIALRDTEEDRSFKVTGVSVTRPGVEESDTLFHPGEKIQTRTIVNKRAYLQLFGIDQNGLAVKLYPVRFTEQELVEPGDTYVFPTQHEMKFGLKIRVSTPKGQDALVESILAIATKEKGRLFSGVHLENASITDIAKKLTAMNSSQWATKSVSYEVRQ
jgi:hypothetical protein